jgi:hypothetical protein
MTRFWTLMVGLTLIALTVRSMSPGGLDQWEVAVLAGMGGLLLVALLIEGVATIGETRETERTMRHRADRGLDALGQPLVYPEWEATGPTTGEPGETQEAPAAGERPPVTPPSAGEVHTLTRTWAVRPDQKLPPEPDSLRRDDADRGGHA